MKIHDQLLKGKIFLIVILMSTSCKKILEVTPPATSINSENVYLSDKTAIQVVTGFFTKLSLDNASRDLVFPGSIFVATGLSSDELLLYDKRDLVRNRYYSNSLSENDGTAWRQYYNAIFRTNAAIEGLEKSQVLTSAVKRQLLGESKFIRAFCYFYLVNLYGDVPLTLGTDPEINRLLFRSPKDQVYFQIISDLKEAENLLSEHHLNETLLNTTSERVRPTKWSAKALLARTYLYIKDFDNAESKSSEIIANTELFNLLPVDQVFLKNSRETIWSLQPVRADNNLGYNTGEGGLFVLPPSGPNLSDTQSYPLYLSNNILANFEAGDARATNWVNSVAVGSNIYPYAFKYKAGRTQSTVTEYSIVFRLSEQYLIRAEARVRQGGAKIAEGIADLNYLRSFRRGAVSSTIPNPLPLIPSGISLNDAYVAVEHERQAELFTEWGHRWFDLKRTPGFLNAGSTRADEIMQLVTANKGGTWSANWELYPIPQSERLKAPNLTNAQNPGY